MFSLMFPLFYEIVYCDNLDEHISKSKISQPPPFANFMKFYGQCPIKGGSIKLSNKHEIAVVHRSVQKKKLALANVFFTHDDQHVLSPGYRLDI